jgi:hypothetical protein
VSEPTADSLGLEVTAPLHVELCYHVLAHLDLGDDPASLYRPDLVERPWVKGLLDAHRRAPARVYLQLLPLWATDLAGLSASLATPESIGLGDEPGRALVSQFATAIETERPAVEAAWPGYLARLEARRAEARAYLAARLRPVRSALWSAQPAGPPPLVLFLCRALGDESGTRGRGTLRDGRSLVAVSVEAPLCDLFCQIVHEEAHHLSDASLGTHREAGPPDTRSASFQLLEDEAVRLGGELIGRHAPALRLAYSRWCRRHGYEGAL